MPSRPRCAIVFALTATNNNERTNNMKAIIETITHLTREEIIAVSMTAATINNPAKCQNMQQAKEWLACLSGWFVYQGGSHLALMKQSGDSRRIMLITDDAPEVNNPAIIAEVRKIAAQKHGGFVVRALARNGKSYCPQGSLMERAAEQLVKLGVAEREMNNDDVPTGKFTAKAGWNLRDI